MFWVRWCRSEKRWAKRSLSTELIKRDGQATTKWAGFLI
jgi:hypothetical protein